MTDKRDKTTKILERSITYPGTIDAFWALLQWLVPYTSVYSGSWVSSDGVRIGFHENELQDGIPSTYKGWTVFLAPFPPSSPARASFEAHQISERETRIVFRDGHLPRKLHEKREPIGPAFEEFVRELVEQFPDRPTTQSLAENKAPGSDSDLVDILLVTVTEVEAHTVLNTLKERYGVECNSVHLGNNTYRDLGEIGSARTYMVRSGKGSTGTRGSTLTVSDAINTLKPSAVVMVGIAFGVDPRSQQIGDVLVSQQILDYSSQRVGTGDGGEMVVTPRGDRVSASAKLLARFENGKYDWDEAEVRFGLILSGPVLVDNVDYRDQLRKLEPEAIGGEMEGAGLYAVARRQKVDWIVVKAICDWADGKKHENKQERQALAAQNAARFTIHVIEQGGFAQSSLPTVTTDLVAKDKLTPEEVEFFRELCNEISSRPQCDYAVTMPIRERLGLDGQSYRGIAEGLIKRGFVEVVPPDIVGRSGTTVYLYLRLTPKGQSYCEAMDWLG